MRSSKLFSGIRREQSRLQRNWQLQKSYWPACSLWNCYSPIGSGDYLGQRWIFKDCRCETPDRGILGAFPWIRHLWNCDKQSQSLENLVNIARDCIKRYPLYRADQVRNLCLDSRIVASPRYCNLIAVDNKKYIASTITTKEESYRFLTD